jgi:hypothetical protein
MLASGFVEESLYEDAGDKRILLQMNEHERAEILASRYEKKRAAERALKSCAYVKKQKLTHVPAYTFRPARNPAAYGADSANGPTPASSSTPSRKVSNSLTASRKRTLHRRLLIYFPSQHGKTPLHRRLLIYFPRLLIYFPRQPGKRPLHRRLLIYFPRQIIHWVQIWSLIVIWRLRSHSLSLVLT